MLTKIILKIKKCLYHNNQAFSPLLKKSKIFLPNNKSKGGSFVQKKKQKDAFWRYWTIKTSFFSI